MADKKQIEGVSNTVGIPGKLTEVGLVLPKKLTYDEWEGVGHTLVAMLVGGKWWVGDWLNEGERRFGETYTQAMSITGKSYQSLANMKWVAKIFPIKYRRKDVEWDVYEALAPLMREDQQAALEILRRADEEDMPTREVRFDVRSAREDLGLLKNAQHRPRDVGIQPPHDTESDDEDEGAVAMPQLLRATQEDDGTYTVRPAAEPEWADELLDIVMAVADADPESWAMVEAHKRAVKWVIEHDMAHLWRG